MREKQKKARYFLFLRFFFSFPLSFSAVLTAVIPYTQAPWMAWPGRQLKNGFEKAPPHLGPPLFLHLNQRITKQKTSFKEKREKKLEEGHLRVWPPIPLPTFVVCLRRHTRTHPTPLLLLRQEHTHTIAHRMLSLFDCFLTGSSLVRLRAYVALCEYIQRLFPFL